METDVPRLLLNFTHGLILKRPIPGGADCGFWTSYHVTHQNLADPAWEIDADRPRWLHFLLLTRTPFLLFTLVPQAWHLRAGPIIPGKTFTAIIVLKKKVLNRWLSSMFYFHLPSPRALLH